MKNILICGSSKGIGRACAKELARGGHRLFLLARSEKKLFALQKDLDSMCESHLISCDIRDEKNLKLKLLESIDKNGPIEVLICNTGGPKSGAILDALDIEFIEAFQAHVLASSQLAKLVIPGMKKKGFGRIINIISTSVKAPIPNLGVSNTIRAAVASWAKTLASEVGPFGITVNNVLPGYTNTDRLKTLIENTSKKEKLTTYEVCEKWQQTILYLIFI